MMKLFIIENYRDEYPDLQGSDLTDALVCDLLRDEGIDDPEILRSELGKPGLASGEVFFSVSHSEDTFACVIADREVGLDIQRVRHLNTERIAERYFTGEEKAYLASAGPSGKEDAFTRLWTRKEAFAKYTGQGLIQVLEGEPVIGRADVEFTDLVLGDGLYGCICI